MQIVEININDIKPYAKNAKKHPDEQIGRIANSLREFGFRQPLVIDKNNVLVIGHGRLAAAKRLGYDTVPCLYADDLTDDQIKALRLADNKTNESDWDFDFLNIELDDITDIDMSQFGFDLGDDDVEPPEIIEDEAPDDVETRAKLGDVWQLGDHRLICGDCTDIAVIDTLMGGVKADMVFTDPPYGYNYQSNMRVKTQKFDVLENDDKILDFFPNLIGNVDGFVFICTTWKVLDKWLLLFTQHYDLSNMIIWDKGGGGIGDLKHTFATDYEVILCAHNGHEIKGKRIASVWDVGKDNANDYKHPTQKPVKLSAMAIEHTTDKAAVVLDVFGGSGSTLIACEQLGRKCYMCELDEHYCDVIIQRWENLTGKEAMLLNGDGR
jgi:site-specific DNA-methyltransferase (adenine-specific)